MQHPDVSNRAVSEWLRRRLSISTGGALADPDDYACSVDLVRMVDELLDDPDDYEASVRALERLCHNNSANNSGPKSWNSGLYGGR